AANRGLLRATDPEALQDSGGTGDFQVNSAALPRSRRKADRSQRMTHINAKITQAILVQLVAKPRLSGVCRVRASSR
ncbi:MAG: hypothetical protein ACKPHU_10705, partial [Planctomycetaceae bacterium]